MLRLTIPFSRLKNNYSPPQSTHYETTEMTQIVDLDSFMALMDSRNSLSDILENEDDDDDDDNSSLSSKSTQREMTENNVKYNYNEDEEDDVPFLGDEAERSLVGASDLENGSAVTRKKVLYCVYITNKTYQTFYLNSRKVEKSGFAWLFFC
jgi:hypothetical protein